MGKVLARHRIEMLMVFTFLGMWLIGELILQLWVPQYYFDFYPVIPVMFMVITLINTNYIRRWEKKLDNGEITRTKVFSYFMVGKMVKMLFCVVVMFCYLKFVNVQRGAFVISFMLYYLVFLTYETMAQYGFERRQRERNGVC